MQDKKPSVDAISEPLEPRHRCISLYLYTQFPRNVRLISSANRYFFGRIVTFFDLRLMNTPTYLFTEEFLVDNIYLIVL